MKPVRMNMNLCPSYKPRWRTEVQVELCFGVSSIYTVIAQGIPVLLYRQRALFAVSFQ